MTQTPSNIQLRLWSSAAPTLTITGRDVVLEVFDRLPQATLLVVTNEVMVCGIDERLVVEYIVAVIERV
jgi:uncharacterized Fe-S cluster-containing radical SAM superfamily protein